MVRLAVLWALLVATTSALAAEHYVGAHPVAARVGGGYCYIDVPHLHSYAPDHVGLYHHDAHGWSFTGDPTVFGYDGERHVFYGHHPVEAPELLFCLIDGPHYHAFAPRGADYQLVDGVAFYMGELPVAYVDQRAQRWRQVNDEMRPFVDARPHVNVYPPTGWQGRIWGAQSTRTQLVSQPAPIRHTRLRIRHDR
jgi:hypothetical protein